MSEPAAPIKVVTIGVYGCKAEEFFAALHGAGVDTFCDIRWRRGVRGSEYAFVNSKRLQKRLSELGIRYLHCRELAPKPELRKQQYEADKAQGTTKRQRTALGDVFIAGYREQCLSSFDSRKFLDTLGSQARMVALFCVEREPAACHRSLLGEKLQQELGVEVVHLIPGVDKPEASPGAS